MIIVLIYVHQILAFNFSNKKEIVKIMGNMASEQQLNKCELIVQPPHSMLNNTRILRKEGKPVLRSSWPFFAKDTFRLWEKEYLSFIDRLFAVKNLQNSRQPLVKNLLLPLNYQYQDINVCSPTGVVTMEYDLPGKSLVDDVEERSLKNEPYKEHQIWILIYQVTKIVSFLHQKDISAGDIRPQNIFVDFQKKNIKITTELSWIGEPTFTSKIASYSDVFVAPEILQIKDRNKQLKRSMFIRNDDFSIGMTLAECILLQDLSKLYEIKGNSRRISKEKYSHLIEKILRIKYYSWKLLFIIVGMFQTNLKERLTCLEVCQLLKHSKKEIANCQDFQIAKEQFRKQIPQKYSVLQGNLEEIDFQTHNRCTYESKVSLFERNFSRKDVAALNKTVKQLNCQINRISSGAMYSMEPPLVHSTVTPYSQDNWRDASQTNYVQISSPFTAVKDPARTDLYTRAPQTSFSFENKISFAKDSSINFVDNERNPFEKTPGSTENKQQPYKLDQIYAITAAKVVLPSIRVLDEDKQNWDETAPWKNDEKLKYHKQLNYDDIQCDSAIHKLQNISVSRSTETLLLMPSVYNVSNAPQSYVSYHYTKSISPQQKYQENDRDDCLSFDTKVFSFEGEVPDSLGPRKKSEEMRENGQRLLSVKQYCQFNRRTIGYNQRAKKDSLK